MSPTLLHRLLTQRRAGRRTLRRYGRQERGVVLTTRRMGRFRVAVVVLAAITAACLGLSGVAQASPPDPNTVGFTTLSHIELNGVLGTNVSSDLGKM